MPLWLDPGFATHVLSFPPLLVLGAAYVNLDSLAMWFWAVTSIGFFLGFSSLTK